MRESVREVLKSGYHVKQLVSSDIALLSAFAVSKIYTKDRILPYCHADLPIGTVEST